MRRVGGRMRNMEIAMNFDSLLTNFTAVKNKSRGSTYLTPHVYPQHQLTSIQAYVPLPLLLSLLLPLPLLLPLQLSLLLQYRYCYPYLDPYPYPDPCPYPKVKQSCEGLAGA